RTPRQYLSPISSSALDRIRLSPVIAAAADGAQGLITVLRAVGQAAPSPRHARACPGHPRLKTWMAGTSPAMTNMKTFAHRSVRNSAGRAAPAHASRGAQADASTVKSAMPKLVVAECAALFRPTRSLHVMPGLRTVGQAAPSPRHARACPGHPRLRR